MRPILIFVSLAVAASPLADRRVVDRVIVGDVLSEQEHAYAAAHEWTRAALHVFDDTEVTVACTFAGTGTARTFDLVVENTTIASYTFRSADSTTVEFRVPLAITSGKTNILVMLRAANGPTPVLLSLRSVQDHNE